MAASNKKQMVFSYNNSIMVINGYQCLKFNFTNRVIPIWNSLSDYVVSAETVNTFKNRLDRFWSNQDVLYDYRADLNGIRNRTIVM